MSATSLATPTQPPSAMQVTLHLMGDPAGALRFPNIDGTLLDG